MKTVRAGTSSVFYKIRNVIAVVGVTVALAACAAEEGSPSSGNGWSDVSAVGEADAGSSFDGRGSDAAAATDAGGSQDFADGCGQKPDDRGDGWGGISDGNDWGSDAASDAGGSDTGGNTNVNLGGTQDFGYFRQVVANGQVPYPGDFEASGFFAEHHTPLPAPDCGEQVCVQGLLGVLTSLFEDTTCTMLQLGLNSPITANPDARPPLSLTVVIDVSGSMSSAGKLDYVQRGLDELIDNLYDEDQLAVVTYSGIAQVVLPPTSMRGSRAAARAVVDSLQANGYTNLYGGLEAGFEVARAAYDSGRQNRVLLLSDGQPSAGITSRDEIRDMARGYTVEGIGLATIGLGSSFDYALMSGLASDGDGTFYFAESAEAVDEIFAEELSYFTVPVAFELELEMVAGEGYDIAVVHGTDRWEGDAATGRLEIPSVFLAHRESDDDVAPGGGRRGGGSALIVELMPRMSMDLDVSDGAEVAEVNLSFREPGSDRLVEQVIRVDYPHAPWVLLDGGFFQAEDTSIAQKSFIMLNVYAGLEAACEDFHFGDRSEGLAKLTRLLAAVVDYNEEVQDVDIAYDIELIEDLIGVFEDQAVRLSGDFEPREDPWEVD